MGGAKGGTRGDLTTIGSQVDMSKTPVSWNDPLASLPGSSYPERLPREVARSVLRASLGYETQSNRKGKDCGRTYR